jgi:hypothetical protein
LPIVREKLNAEEKKLFDQDPVIGARVLLHAIGATSSAEELYEDTALHNGNGDAFRHMYWNYRMGSDPRIGVSWAERWGNAHEDGAGNQPPLEKSMDLHNNWRGRQLASERVDDDPRALRAAVRSGSCRILVGGALVRSSSQGEK